MVLLAFIFLSLMFLATLWCLCRALDAREEARQVAHNFRVQNEQLKTELHNEQQAHAEATRLRNSGLTSYKFLHAESKEQLAEIAKLTSEVARLTRKRDDHGRYVKQS